MHRYGQKQRNYPQNRKINVGKYAKKTTTPTSGTVSPSAVPTVDAITATLAVDAAKYGNPTAAQNIVIAFTIPFILFMFYICYLSCRAYKMETAYRQVPNRK